MKYKLHNLAVTLIVLGFMSLRSFWRIPDYHNYASLYASINSFDHLLDVDIGFSILVLVLKNIFQLDYNNFRLTLFYSVCVAALVYSYKTDCIIKKYFNIFAFIYLCSVYMHGQLRQGLGGLILYLFVLYSPTQRTYMFALPVSGLVHFSFLPPLVLQFFRFHNVLIISLVALFVEFDKIAGLYKLYSGNNFDIPTSGFAFRAIFFSTVFLVGFEKISSGFPLVCRTVLQIFALVLILIPLELDTIADRVLTVLTFLIFPILTHTIHNHPIYKQALLLIIVIAGTLIWAVNSQNI